MRSPRLGYRRLIFPTLLTLSLSFQAQADELDDLNVSLGTGLVFEDNVFRLPDSANTRQSTGRSQRSDQVMISNVGLKLDKPYALQRFQVDLDAIDHRYSTFDYLNYTAFNYRLAWLWQLTPNIKGKLQADQFQVLNSFSEFRDFNNQLNLSRSIQTNQNRLFDIDATISGGWHLLAGLSELRSRNSIEFNAVGDFIQTGANLGIQYIAASENSIALVQRAFNGTYQGRIASALNQLDTGFKQHETELQLQWRLSGKSLIDGKLAYLNREHDNFNRRDYSGMVGRLAYNWQPTAKLGIVTSLSRNIYSFQQAVNSYFIADTFAISPIWHLTPKTSLNLRYDFSQRDYRGAIIPVAKNRDDHVQSLMLAADWRPTNTIKVTASVRHERRDSSFNSPMNAGGDLQYDANTALINAQLLF